MYESTQRQKRVIVVHYTDNKNRPTKRTYARNRPHFTSQRWKKLWSKIRTSNSYKTDRHEKVTDKQRRDSVFFFLLLSSFHSFTHPSFNGCPKRETAPNGTLYWGYRYLLLLQKISGGRNDDCPVGLNGTNRALGVKQSEEIIWVVDVFGLCSKPSCTCWDLLVCIFVFWYCGYCWADEMVE